MKHQGDVQAHEPLRITLVETSPAGEHGSMARYADLTAHALSLAGNDAVQVRRLNLALSADQLAGVPPRFRNWVHLSGLFKAARKLGSTDADIFHIIDGSQAWVAGGLRQKNTVATAHDIIPLLQVRNRFPFPPPGRMAQWLIDRSIRGLQGVDRIIADSSWTRDDLVSEAGVGPGNIEVIHLALPLPAVRESQRVLLPLWKERRNSPRAYVLHIGNNGFYKNRAGVLRIFGRIRAMTGVRLIMAGPPADAGLLSQVDSLGLAGRVDFVVNPDDTQIGDLYRNASLLLFPSMYEGYGWPPLEAMAFGCPVVCSSAASLPEVVEDAALFCPPDEEERMAGLCREVLDNPILAEKLVARGHNRVEQLGPVRMGEMLLAVYRQVIHEK
jgi:glycosyltransferase involved in cell wall biosynthesis